MSVRLKPDTTCYALLRRNRSGVDSRRGVVNVADEGVLERRHQRAPPAAEHGIGGAWRDEIQRATGTGFDAARVDVRERRRQPCEIEPGDRTAVRQVPDAARLVDQQIER